MRYLGKERTAILGCGGQVGGLGTGAKKERGRALWCILSRLCFV